MFAPGMVRGFGNPLVDFKLVVVIFIASVDLQSNVTMIPDL